MKKMENNRSDIEKENKRQNNRKQKRGEEKNEKEKRKGETQKKENLGIVTRIQKIENIEIEKKTENKNQKTGNGKWELGNANGKWKTGKWKMGNGKM